MRLKEILGLVMPPKARSDATPVPLFRDYERVRLIKAVETEGKIFPLGSIGTIVYCHGSKAYEIEFDDVRGSFTIRPEDLKKI